VRLLMVPIMLPTMRIQVRCLDHWLVIVPGSQRAGKGEFVITTAEIASEVYRLDVYRSPTSIWSSVFLVRDDELLLFHAGVRGMFVPLREEALPADRSLKNQAH